MSTCSAVLPPSDLSFETIEPRAQTKPTNDQDFLEEVIKALGEPGNKDIFRKAIKELGIRAVKADEAIARVKSTFDAFVKEYGKQYPGIIPFQQEWNGYESRYRVYISTSRNFAIQTVSEYENYTVYLKTFGEIHSKEELQELADALTKFATNQPIGVPPDFRDSFLKLGRQVVDFQNRFNKYVIEQGSDLEKKAKALKHEIESLKVDIESLDKQIKDATLGLGLAPWWGLVAVTISGTVIGLLGLKRAQKYKEFDAKRDELREVEALQTPLGKIQAQLAGLVPDFSLLCQDLGWFSDLWDAFHKEALDFATKFKELEKPDDLPMIYKARIALALAVSDPLIRGLKDYASVIHF